ncbi:MAG: energy transducer TonB [Steroidobacteraceae bacterium]
MRSQGIVALLALMAGVSAHADFPAALGQYQAGQYEAAKREFLQLAGLGNAAAQHNLGTMALHGQGGAEDRGEAYGWFLAAGENGNHDLSAGQLEDLRSQLSPADEAKATPIVAAYGRDALAAHVLPPSPETGACVGYAPPAMRIQAPTPYAYAAREVGRSGVGVVSFTVGADGLARDQNVVSAMPHPAYGQPAVDAILHSRFTPATAGGQPIEARSWAFIGFKLSAGVSSIWDRGILAGLKARAAGGDLPSLYLYGLIARLDPGLGETAAEADAMILEAAQNGSPDAQYWIAMELDESRRCSADRALPWLRAAAQGGHDAARIALAERLLQGEPDAARIAEAKGWFIGVVGSRNAYATKHAIARLAASPIEALRDPQAALRASATLFVKDYNYSQDPQTYEALAAARAASGDFKGAVAPQKSALAAAEALHWNTALMRERLAAYEAGRMWYGDLLAVPRSHLAIPDPRGGTRAASR